MNDNDKDMIKRTAQATITLINDSVVQASTSVRTNSQREQVVNAFAWQNARTPLRSIPVDDQRFLHDVQSTTDVLMCAVAVWGSAPDDLCRQFASTDELDGMGENVQLILSGRCSDAELGIAGVRILFTLFSVRLDDDAMARLDPIVLLSLFVYAERLFRSGNTDCSAIVQRCQSLKRLVKMVGCHEYLLQCSANGDDAVSAEDTSFSDLCVLLGLSSDKRKRKAQVMQRDGDTVFGLLHMSLKRAEFIVTREVLYRNALHVLAPDHDGGFRLLYQEHVITETNLLHLHARLKGRLVDTAADIMKGRVNTSVVHIVSPFGSLDADAHTTAHMPGGMSERQLGTFLHDNDGALSVGKCVVSLLC